MFAGERAQECFSMYLAHLYIPHNINLYEYTISTYICKWVCMCVSVFELKETCCFCCLVVVHTIHIAESLVLFLPFHYMATRDKYKNILARTHQRPKLKLIQVIIIQLHWSISRFFFMLLFLFLSFSYLYLTHSLIHTSQHTEWIFSTTDGAFSSLQVLDKETHHDHFSPLLYTVYYYFFFRLWFCTVTDWILVLSVWISYCLRFFIFSLCCCGDL